MQLAALSFESFLSWVAHNPDAVLIAVFGIFVFFAVTFGLFANGLRSIQHDIDGLRAFVDAGNLDIMKQKGRYSEGYREVLDAALVPTGVKLASPVGRRFERYHSSLVPFRENDEDAPRVFSQTAAAEAFEFSSLLADSLNIRFYQAVPNLLLGIGLLFTFVGLTAALSFATHGAQSGNVAQTQTAIQGLLAAASFKFVTSLVALFCSIGFLWSEKMFLQRTERKVAGLVDVLDDTFPVLTTERLLLGMTQDWYIRKSAKAFRDQYNQKLVESLAQAVEDTLAPRISETFGRLTSAIENTLAPSITGTIDRLNATLGDIGNKIYRLNERALKQLLDDFALALEVQTRESFLRVADAADRLSGDLLARLAEFNAHFDELRSIVADVSVHGSAGVLALETTAHALQTARDDIQSSRELLPLAVDAVVKGTAGITDAAAQLRATHDALNLVVASSRRAVDAVDRSVTSARDVAVTNGTVDPNGLADTTGSYGLGRERASGASTGTESDLLDTPARYRGSPGERAVAGVENFFRKLAGRG